MNRFLRDVILIDPETRKQLDVDRQMILDGAQKQDGKVPKRLSKGSTEDYMELLKIKAEAEKADMKQIQARTIQLRAEERQWSRIMRVDAHE